jgi:hypothetical protein
MNELERLLVRAREDPAARPRFYRALADHTLYVLTPVPMDEGSRTVQAEEQIQIIHWLDGDQQIIPIFSSLERLNEAVRQVPEKYGYLGVRGRELFGILSQGDLPAVLNPNWSHGRTFLPNEIARLAEGTFSDPASTEIIERERSVLVGQPKEYPHDLVVALKKCFSSEKKVAAAYLALYVDPKVGPEPRLVVTIASTGDARSVVKDAGVIAREIMNNGPAVDFVVTEKGADAPLSGGSEPFYTRKK